MPLRKLRETNISNERNLEHRSWRETDQLAVYNHDRGVELGPTERQLQRNRHSEASTRNLRISSPALFPLDLRLPPWKKQNQKLSYESRPCCTQAEDYSGDNTAHEENIIFLAIFPGKSQNKWKEGESLRNLIFPPPSG